MQINLTANKLKTIFDALQQTHPGCATFTSPLLPRHPLKQQHHAKKKIPTPVASSPQTKKTRHKLNITGILPDAYDFTFQFTAIHHIRESAQVRLDTPATFTCAELTAIDTQYAAKAEGNEKPQSMYMGFTTKMQAYSDRTSRGRLIKYMYTQ